MILHFFGNSIERNFRIEDKEKKKSCTNKKETVMNRKERNEAPMFRVKSILQFIIILIVSIWIVYQLYRSGNLIENYRRRSNQHIAIVLGRKGGLRRSSDIGFETNLYGLNQLVEGNNNYGEDEYLRNHTEEEGGKEEDNEDNNNASEVFSLLKYGGVILNSVDNDWEVVGFNDENGVPKDESGNENEEDEEEYQKMKLQKIVDQKRLSLFEEEEVEEGGDESRKEYIRELLQKEVRLA